MADILYSAFGQIVQRYKDMGDGSYAKVVYTGGSGASANQVQGAAAGNAAAVGSPVQTGGWCLRLRRAPTTTAMRFRCTRLRVVSCLQPSPKEAPLLW